MSEEDESGGGKILEFRIKPHSSPPAVPASTTLEEQRAEWELGVHSDLLAIRVLLAVVVAEQCDRSPDGAAHLGELASRCADITARSILDDMIPAAAEETRRRAGRTIKEFFGFFSARKS
jgi:hypothetical protein